MEKRRLVISAFFLFSFVAAIGARGAGWVTSGSTAISTTSDAAVSVTAITPGNYTTIVFINHGTVDGLFSIDGVHFTALYVGATALPGPVTIVHSGDVQIQRVAGGANMTNCWVYGY
jgi:hypothetical protein